MAGFILTVPKQYRARLGGKAKISISGDTERDARVKLVEYGIPYAATNSFGIEPQSQTRTNAVGKEYTDLRDFGEAGRSAAPGSTLLSDIAKKSGPSLVDSGVPGGGALGANSGGQAGYMVGDQFSGRKNVLLDSGEQGDRVGGGLGVSQFDPTTTYKPKTAADFRQIMKDAAAKRDRIESQLPAFDIEADSTGNSASVIEDIIGSQGLDLGGAGDGGIVPPVVVEPPAPE